jgi:hypothetical protein
MNYVEMTKTFTAKAAKCRTLWEVEICLKDIRETLRIWQEEMLIETLHGNPVNNLYVQKLLCERDAYLARYDQLKRKMEKA